MLNSDLGLLAIDANSEWWLEKYGWGFLAFFALFIISLYLWSYVTKNFERLKLRESKYYDSEIIQFLGHAIKAFITIILVFSLLYVLSLTWDEFRTGLWEHFYGYFLELIFIIILILCTILIAKILRRMSKLARIKSAREGSIHSSAVEFTTLFLSYILYIFVSIIIILIIISMIPGANPYDTLIEFLNNNQASIGSMVVIVVAILIAVKLIETILEDYKFRSKRFNPQAIDLFKISIKYALFLVAAFSVIFIFFTLLELELVGFLLVVVTFVFIIIGIVFSYSTARNVVSGLTIMESNPFEVGDVIKIGDNLECEVLDKELIFTRVKTLNGELVEIPNSELIENRIYNYSRSESYAISFTADLPYEIPFETVVSSIKSAANQTEGVDENREPEAIATGIFDGKIRYEFVVHIKNPSQRRKVLSDIIINLQNVFQQSGVKIT